MALVGLLRSALEDDNPTAAAWLHRGLTSQDVVDTALMLMAQDAVAQLQVEIRGQAERLAVLADDPPRHPDGRPHAHPARRADHVRPQGRAVADRRARRVRRPRRRSPSRCRSAARPAPTPRSSSSAASPPGARSSRCAAAARPRARRAVAHPRATAVTRLGDALVRCTDAWGRIAEDVLALAGPRSASSARATGGGSSTMPQKQNPVLSVLVRRAALTTPMLAATLHLAAAQQVDERPTAPGTPSGRRCATWSAARWSPASQTFDLVADLAGRPRPDGGDAARRARAAWAPSSGRMAELAGTVPSFAYLGIADRARRRGPRARQGDARRDPVEATP